MTLTSVDSIMLSAIGYDPRSQELEAVFANGAIWRYRNVPEEVYKQLRGSESKGSCMRMEAAPILLSGLLRIFWPSRRNWPLSILRGHVYAVGRWKNRPHQCVIWRGDC